MTRATISILTIVVSYSLYARIADAEPKSVADKVLRDKIVGTWRPVSNDTRTGSPLAIKHVTKTHFTWVVYDRTTKKVIDTAGGRFWVKDSSCSEQVEYYLGQDLSLLGKVQTLNCRVEQNRLFLSGVLTRGEKIDEIWERVQ
jgi:hypothetical protein